MLLPHLRGPAADPDPVPQRGRRGELLREERAGRHADVGARGRPCRCPGRRPAGRRWTSSWSTTSPPWPGWPTSPRIELHTPQWRLDGDHAGRARTCSWSTSTPGPPAGLAECCLVAVAARHRLELDGLTPLAKTSGQEGHAAAVPAARRPQPPTRSPRYAEAVAEDLERALPELVTARMTKSLRPGKVFFDWSQNVAAKTTVSRLLAAGRADPDRLRPVHLGRGRVARRVRPLRPARCWPASTPTATSWPPSSDRARPRSPRPEVASRGGSSGGGRWSGRPRPGPGPRAAGRRPGPASPPPA